MNNPSLGITSREGATAQTQSRAAAPHGPPCLTLGSYSPFKEQWQRGCGLSLPLAGPCLGAAWAVQTCPWAPGVLLKVLRDPWAQHPRSRPMGTLRAMQAMLQVISLCLRVCQGAISRYLCPCRPAQAPHGRVIAGALLRPGATAKLGCRRESPSQPGARVPRHWLALSCRRSRPWEEAGSCTHL